LILFYFLDFLLLDATTSDLAAGMASDLRLADAGAVVVPFVFEAALLVLLLFKSQFPSADLLRLPMKILNYFH